MGEKNPEVIRAKKEAKYERAQRAADVAAAEAGIRNDAESREAAAANQDFVSVSPNGNVVLRDGNGRQTTIRIQELERQAQAIQQLQKQLKANSRRDAASIKKTAVGFKKVKEYIDSAVKDAVSEINDIKDQHAQLHTEVKTGADEAGMLFNAIWPFVNAFIEMVNVSDTPQQPMALAAARAIDAMDLDLGFSQKSKGLLSGLLRIIGYYDPAVGLQSILSADETTTSSTAAPAFVLG